jgi:hypothetical protein
LLRGKRKTERDELLEKPLFRMQMTGKRWGSTVHEPLFF